MVKIFIRKCVEFICCKVNDFFFKQILVFRKKYLRLQRGFFLLSFLQRNKEIFAMQHVAANNSNNNNNSSIPTS